MSDGVAEASTAAASAASAAAPALAENASSSSSSTAAAAKVASVVPSSEEEMISRHLAKQRAKRKSRSKRLQFQFLFKSAAFLVMLAVVLITKYATEWYEGYKAAQNGTAIVEPVESDPVPQFIKDQKEGEL
mmetsp:Transcript_57093/g.163978  ORF Transcript_57093/g.163978 Transcript_57093/m.163978 type:complete len:132 (+) Transcript_57093:82-477(+)